MDDATAVRACRAGDVDAFRYLVDRYQTRALAHARILTRNEADAADATQEAFVDAFRNLTAYEPGRPFYAWFYVLLRNRCYKQRSRRGTRPESGIVPESGVAPTVSAAHLDLWRAIGRLSPDDGELIVLKHIEGWTYEELSRALSVPRGTVMSRLHASTATAVGHAFRRATVNTSTECERLRLQRMALLDGEGGTLSEPDQEHLSDLLVVPALAGGAGVDDRPVPGPLLSGRSDGSLDRGGRPDSGRPIR